MNTKTNKTNKAKINKTKINKTINSEFLDDNEIIKLIKENDEFAFNHLLEKYQNKIFSLAIRYLKNQEDAEEVTQDVFSTIFRKIDSFQGKSAFSSWIYRITVNAAFMKLRKRKQKPTVYIEDLGHTVKQKHLEIYSGYGASSDSLTLNKELRTHLKKAIDSLADSYKSVFVLRDVNGLTNQETAKLLNLTIAGVKSRLHRARLMLKEELNDYYNDYKEIKNIDNLDLKHASN